MNRPLVAAGLILAILAVAAYAARAWRLGKRPDLAVAFHVGIGGAGIPASLRLIGFPFTEAFQKLVASADTSWWSLSGEDALFMVLGGLAIAWVSVAAIWDGFSKLKP